MKCLVTKLKETVENDNLPYFNKVVIPLSKLAARYFTIMTLQLDTDVTYYPSTDNHNRTTEAIKVSIGDTLTFAGLESIFGNDTQVNIRMVIFDNVNNYTTLPKDFECKLKDIALYNYGNYTKRVFTIPDNEFTQSASNLCVAVTFIEKEPVESLLDGAVTISFD